MGWASAGAIFDPVARALIDLGADEHTKREVLGPLIDTLRAEDWDTCEESLQEFSDDLVIRALFYERGIGNETYDEQNDGTIDYSKKTDEWLLLCSGRDCGQVARRPGTVEGHDELVRLWAAHSAEKHGGSGRVPEWMLIDRGSAS